MKIRGHFSASLVVNQTGDMLLLRKFIQRFISRGMESVKEIWYLIFSDVETITLILSKYSAQRPISTTSKEPSRF